MDMTTQIIETEGQETFLEYAARPRSIRDYPEYRAMDGYRAVGIAEGFEEPNDIDEQAAAWQFLYDNPGYAAVLAGSLNQNFEQLIEQGLIEE